MWKQSAGCLLAAFETSSLHIVIVWYCLTCNRCSFSRFLYFSVYYYFYDLSYVIIFVLSSARKFFLCSIFSWHGSRCHFRTRTSIRWEIIAGDVLMLRSMNFIVSGMKKYEFFYLFRFMSILLTDSIVNRIFNDHLSVNRRFHWINVLDALKNLFASTLRLVLSIIPC